MHRNYTTKEMIRSKLSIINTLQIFFLIIFILDQRASYSLLISSLSKSFAYTKKKHTIFPLAAAIQSRNRLYNSNLSNKSKISSTSRLYLDVFGLGFPEVVVTVVAATFLYGTGKGNNDKKEKEFKIKDLWRREHNERIAEVKEYAVKSRHKRAWKIINKAIEEENPSMIAKLAQLDEKNQDIKMLSKYKDGNNDEDDNDDYYDSDDDSDIDEDDDNDGDNNNDMLKTSKISIENKEVVI